MSGEALERRYRRLLAWYPAEHRALYEREMLGVLMEGAGPDRTHPTLSERYDLIRGALRSRLRTLGPALRGRTWPDAAAVAGFVAPLFVFERVVELFVYLRGEPLYLTSALTWVWQGATTAALVAVLLGWRWVAAGLGWVVLLCQVLPDGMPTSQWMVPLAVVVAVSLTLAIPGRRVLALLGAKWVAVMTAVVLLSALGYVLVFPLAAVPARLLLAASVLAAPVACLLALRRIPAPVRRRALSLLAF